MVSFSLSFSSVMAEIFFIYTMCWCCREFRLIPADSGGGRKSEMENGNWKFENTGNLFDVYLKRGPSYHIDCYKFYYKGKRNT